MKYKLYDCLDQRELICKSNSMQDISKAYKQCDKDTDMEWIPELWVDGVLIDNWVFTRNKISLKGGG